MLVFGRCRGGPEQGAGGVERSDHDPEASCAGPVSGGWLVGFFGGKPSWWSVGGLAGGLAGEGERSDPRHRGAQRP